MRFRSITVLAATALIAAGVLMAAPAASADTSITWYQSVGRPSADAACPATPAEDVAEGWTEWAPSWEEWANDGAGGPVCTRSIVWAYQSDAGSGTALPSANCILTYTAYYADFDGNYYLPPGSTTYSDSGCVTVGGILGYGYVYAPDGADQAATLCRLAFGVEQVNGSFAPDVYQCNT